MSSSFEGLVASADVETCVRLTEMLVNNRLIPVCCSTLGEARSMLLRHRICLVSSDYRFPDGDFHDVLPAVEASASRVPVILTSRTIDSIEYLDAMSSGAFDCVRCPWAPRELQRIVESRAKCRLFIFVRARSIRARTLGRKFMTNTGMDVLLVGEGFHVGAQALTDRLRRWGFRCHFAGTMQAALQFLKSRGVDVVLSQMRLPDGSGFGLVATLAGLPVTAFLCVPLEDSCLWIPAIERGRDCWGREMLRPADFTRALEELAQRGPAAPLVSPPILQADAA